MVNTRILEQRLGWQRAGDDAPTPRGGSDRAPQALRHEPLLQGRIVTGQRPALPAAAGLIAARTPVAQAGISDSWAALPRLADTLEAAAGRQGTVPAFGRTHPTGIALDHLRNQVLRVVADKGWRRIGIAAPRRGAGASFLALGLAASLARLDYLHVLLVDLDLARPSLHAHLGVEAPGPLEAALDGSKPIIEHVRRVGDSLALLLNDTPIPEAAELVYSPEAAVALHGLNDGLQPDLTLCDLPPLLTDPAAQAAIAQVEAILLVADGTSTTARDIADCERLLDGQIPLLGVVLNKSDDRDPASGRG